MVAAGFTKTDVASVTTLGQLLRAAREAKELDLVEAELGTNIAGKYLAALEESRYHELPADVYGVGFVKRYARWLELDVVSCLKQYRVEAHVAAVANPRHSAAIRQLVRPRQPLAKPRLWITPERFLAFAAGLATLAVISYLWFQVKSFAAGPNLNVATVVDNSVVHVDTLTLAGSTDAKAKLAINGQAVPVDRDGTFSATLRLIEGMNTIELRAERGTDKQTVKVLKVLATLDEAGTIAGPQLPVQTGIKN